VAHHDEGWKEIDATNTINPQTHLPYHLTQTPILRLIATGNGSPDYNEARAHYSGLLSSMHTYGLYHGRYGLSDKIFIDNFPAEYRPQVDAMLAVELERQERLKIAVRTNPFTAPYGTDEGLFHNYKLLQFFDTMALYFHMTHPSQRGVSQFQHVPRTVGDDVTLTIEPLDDERGENYYRLTPFPFDGEVSFATIGRLVNELPDDADVAQTLAALPIVVQSARIVE
jgi:hypothetical protein